MTEQTLDNSIGTIYACLELADERSLERAAQLIDKCARPLPVALVDAILLTLARGLGTADIRAALLGALGPANLSEPSGQAAVRAIAGLAAGDPSALIRGTAIQVLSRANTTNLEQLLAALDDPAPLVRACAAQALPVHDHDIIAIPLRMAYLREQNGDARAALLAALAELGDIQDLDILNDALDDPSLRLIVLDSFFDAFYLPDLLAPDRNSSVSDDGGWRAGLRRLLAPMRRTRTQRVATMMAEKIRQIMLADDNPACRAAAARTLRFCPRMASAFARALMDDVDEVLEQVLVGLDSQDDARDALPALIACYARRPHLRRSICDVIKRQDHPDASAFLSTAYRLANGRDHRLDIVDGDVLHPLPIAAPMLLAALADEDIEVRRAAARRVGDVAWWDAAAPDDLRKTLADALVATFVKETEPDVRIDALHSLCEVGTPAVLPTLVAALDVTDQEGVRTAIAEALAEIDPRASEAVLVELARDDCGATRHVAADGLARIGNAAAVPSLMERIEDPHIRTHDRAELIEHLGMAGKAHVEPALLSLLHDKDPYIAAAAAAALGYCPTPGAFAALVQRLEAVVDDNVDDEDVRANAMKALAEIGDVAAAPAIGRYLTDANPRLRLRALRAYASIEGIDAIAVLERALSDENDAIREESEFILDALENGESRNFHQRGMVSYE